MKHAGKSEQHKASLHRKLDAEKLRDARRFRGAMYLLGYAVECSLKAKLMEKYALLTLAELQEYLRQRVGNSIDVFTHSLHELMEWTKAEHRMDNHVKRHWGVIRTWQVHWRYNPQAAGETECTEFFEAADGVLQFIRGSI